MSYRLYICLLLIIFSPITLGGPLLRGLTPSKSILSSYKEYNRLKLGRGPITSLSFGRTNEAIYGSDGRANITASSKLEIRQLSSSIAGQVWNRQLLPGNDRGYSFVAEPFENAARICKDERFIKENVLPRCTGFLITPSILLTAGHCLESVELVDDPQGVCDQTSWVFDYYVGTKNLKENQVYQCKKVLHYSQGEQSDYALIELSQNTKRKPLSFSMGPTPIKTKIMTIGHGSHLPLKLYDDAQVMKKKGKLLVANLDTFAGNSGSPIINKETGEVIGVLIGGAEDYTYDNERFCLKSIRLSDTEEDAQEELLPLRHIEPLNYLLRSYHDDFITFSFQ